MGKKQNDYLNDLLGQPDGTSAEQSSEAPALSAERPNRAGMSLLGRESALARVASGEVRQVTQLQLDPARVRLWPGNARIQARLSEANVRDLIDAIIAEGGQKVPVIVRRLSGDPAYDYELVVGTRRHFAIRWLRANNYPDMTLLAQVADLSDEAAFRLADIENRARQDVTEIERARNYVAALADHYGGKQVRMAERLRLSKGWLSKMLKAGSLPVTVLDSFPELGALTLNPAYALASALDEPIRATAILAEARQLTADQQQATDTGTPLLPFAAVYQRLMAAGLTPTVQPTLYTAVSRYGRPLLSVTATNRQALVFKVHAGSGSSEDELVEHFRAALAYHKTKVTL